MGREVHEIEKLFSFFSFIFHGIFFSLTGKNVQNRVLLEFINYKREKIVEYVDVCVREDIALVIIFYSFKNV